MNSSIPYINKKAVAILRVSSFKQEDNFSHGVQLKYAEQYAAKDCGGGSLDLVKVFNS
jgi:pyruvate/2-oxoglutarate dehydrogenase complex dihydrolipoamide acyltransferase (E2) component